MATSASVTLPPWRPKQCKPSEIRATAVAHACIKMCIMRVSACFDTCTGALGEGLRPAELLTERLGDGIAEGAEI